MQTKFNILISRTDSIGDVILTLPMAGILKQKYPDSKISFLGKKYTRDIINACEHIDDFICNDELTKQNYDEQIKFIAQKQFTHCVHVFPVYEIAQLIRKAKVPVRIGTTNRVFHWVTCNKLIRLSRKKSDLHEAQLNCKLLATFEFDKILSIKELNENVGFTNIQKLDECNFALLDSDKKNIIIHPKSQGSANEWAMDNYVQLIKKIDHTKYKVFISGTENERQYIQQIITNCPEVNDIVGKFDLKQFISFINEADALIACSTGPLHIASVCGKNTIGLFTNIRPMHPGRWAPIGNKSRIILMDNDTNTEINSILNELEKI
jgi:ADP-heptose:LPS heptosyltransferase